MNGKSLKSYIDTIFNGGIPRCDDCNGLVKPDIVFFGENLPYRFFESLERDFAEADLLIVMGTSLTVHPFASLIAEPATTVPRLLINREICGVVLFCLCIIIF
jgi:NAD-dependent deacetylase sirtuin 2